MAFVVGVDGGASKTVALIATEGGKVVGRGQSGSSNHQNVGSGSASEAIRAAVHQARVKAHLTRKELAVGVVSLAGIDSNRDVVAARRFVRKANVASRTFFAHDSVSALYAATKGAPGIIVNSGTGSFAAGINSRGVYARVGGWGYLAGDEGSAYDIGRMALVLSFRMLDGREKTTGLQNVICKHFQVTSLEDARAAIHRSKVEEIAGLSLTVSRLAPSDGTCEQILKRAGFELGDLACAVARKLEMTEDVFPVVGTGGGFKSGHYLTRSFACRIREECPNAVTSILRIEPAHGALIVALRKLREQKLLAEKPSSLNNVLHAT